MLLRERAIYVEIGPAGLSTPRAAVRAEDARMMVTATRGILLKMQDLGLPPPKGTLKWIAQNPTGGERP